MIGVLLLHDFPEYWASWYVMHHGFWDRRFARPLPDLIKVVTKWPIKVDRQSG